jgi:hypothetical protein
MLSPSGRRLLEGRPALDLICFACLLKRRELESATHVWAAAPETIIAELLDTIPNLRRQRN